MKLTCKDKNSWKYLTITLHENKSLEESIQRAGIQTQDILGVYFAEIDAQAELLRTFYDSAKHTIKMFNLASLYAEQWLRNQNFSPESFVHLGFVGDYV